MPSLVRCLPDLDRFSFRGAIDDVALQASIKVSMRNRDIETFCWDFEKQERIRATYQVHLVMPAWYYGSVEVEADTGEEAARLAIDEHFFEVDWSDSDGGDPNSAEVIEVLCEHPPVNTFLVDYNSSGRPNPAPLFLSEEATGEALSTSESAAAVKEDDGGRQCK